MLKGYVLRTLAGVAEGGPPGVVSAPGVLRAWVGRAAQKHVALAGFETEHADDAVHVHRLAYLRAVGMPAPDPNAREDVTRRFVTFRRPATEARAGLRAFASLAAVALLAGGSVALAAMLRDEPPPRSAPRPERSLEDALAEALGETPGALPAHPLEPLFERALPSYTVALDHRAMGRERAAPDDVATHRARVLEALAGVGMDETTAGFLDASEGYVDGTTDADQWLNRLVLFHDALAERDVPFFVDGELRAGRQRVLLSTYRVRARRTFRAGAETVRSLDIARLDTLNVERSLLGYTRPEVRYALVVVDRIERFLVEDVLPSVNAAGDSVIVRDYADETGIEWVTTFEEAAHEDLRREAEHIVSTQRVAALNRLAQTIVARRQAIATVSRTVGGGVRLREPRTYDYDIDELDHLTGRADPSALRAARLAAQVLDDAEVRRAYALLLEARALSVAEHEVQHRLDYEAGRLVTVPEVLARTTGDSDELDGMNRFAERANAELSAYLTQIARRPSLAWTSLVHVASFLMSRPSWRMPEAYAAAALFESLADEAELAHRPLIDRRRIDRGEAARLYAALRAQLDGDGLAALAARTWSRLYGAPLEPLALVE